MFPFKLYYQLFLHDKNGKLVRKTRKRRSRSFVLQYLQIIETFMRQGSVKGLDINGIERTFQGMIGSSTAAYCLRLKALAGDDKKGIVVGTGSTAPANDDYALESQIMDGTGSGQLYYQDQAVGQAQIIGNNVDLTLTRAFTNNSGATITIREIGMYCHCDVAYYVCILRDVLPAGKDVLNGETLTVQYTLRTTV